MIYALGATLLSALLALFSSFGTSPHSALSSLAAAVEPSVSTATTSKYPPPQLLGEPASSTPVFVPTPEPHSAGVVRTPASSVRYLTTVIAAPASTDVANRLDSLIGIVGNVTSLLPGLEDTGRAVIPEQVAAGGNGGIAAASNIGTLSNVVISNPVITGGSVPASSIVGTVGNAIDTALGEIDDLTSATITAENASTSNLAAANAAIANLSIGSLSLGNALSISSGGTGLFSAPTSGQLLIGNSSGGYSLVATSSLGFPATDGYKSVTDFGAKCDGSTDDLAAFTAAMAWVSARGHGTITIPPSSSACMLSGPITVPSGLTLWATPGAATLKPTPGNTANPMLLNASGVANVLIHGVTFDGGGATFANSNPVTQAYQATHLVFDQVTWQNTAGMGFNGSELNTSGVENSTLINVGNLWKTTLSRSDRHQGVSFCCGIPGSWGYDNFVVNSYFQDIGLDAISAGNATRLVVSNNHFNLADNQFNLLPSPDYPAAIFATNSTSSVISNNVITDAQGNGIDMPGLSDSVISGNTITRSGGSGIGLFVGYDGVTSPVNDTISDNTLIDNAQWSAGVNKFAITLMGGSPKNVTITGNIASDDQAVPTQNYGLGISTYESTTPTNLWIDQSNDFTGNAIGGLYNSSYSQTWGFFNTPGTGGGYQIGGNLILQASSTIASTLVGQGAGINLLATTSASGNTALGFQSLLYATSSSYNTALGYQALLGSATAGSNFAFDTAVGYGAMSADTIGSFNTALGYGALRSNTSGIMNTAIGYLAGSSITANGGLTAVGALALLHADNANGGDIGIGNSAGMSVTSGSSDIYIGPNAGLNNTTGNQSTMVGAYAGWGNGEPNYAQTGDSYFGFGVQSNGGASVSSANVFNTAFGWESFYNGTSGYDNLCLGALSCDNLTSGYNNVAIGWNTNLPSPTANNQLNIGNIIFGTNLPTTTSGVALPVPTGNIGIDLINPNYTLEVNGTASTTNLFTQSLVAQASSTIGNGTQGLTVFGNATTTGNIFGQGSLSLTGTTGTTTIAAGQGFTIGGSQFIVQQGSGNVGIRQTPTASLSITSVGTSTDGIALFPNVWGGDLRIMPNLSGGNFNPLIQQGDSGIIFSSTPGPGSGNLVIAPWNNSPYGMRLIGSNGYVGIDTSSPVTTFSVAGSGYLSGGLGVGLLNVIPGTLQTSGNAMFGGNVGIGTSTPATLLSIAGTTGIYASTTATSTFQGGGINLVTAAGNTGCFAVNGVCIGNSYFTNSGASTWLSTGTKLGINTVSPSYALDVAGFINTDQYSGFKQAGNTVLYASSTNQSLALGASSAAAWMSASSTPWYDVAIGSGALATAPTSGTALYNIAIGLNALYSNTTGSQNTANGVYALQNNTTGTYNTALGYNALASNTSGIMNTAIGYLAGSSITSNGGLTAIGSLALLNANNSNGGDVGIGTSAGMNVTGGSADIYIGNNTGLSNTTGNQSTMVGEYAGWGNGEPNYAQTGDSYFGYAIQSNGGAAVTGANIFNTALGWESFYNGTSGYDNLCLGVLSCDNLTSGYNNIAIGWNTNLPSPTANNQLNIGNIIFGTNLPATSSGTSVPSTLTGNISIGTTTPYSTLEVWGPTSAATSSLFSVVNNASTTVFAAYANGNATYAGSIFQSSDQRLKNNVVSLDGSTSLSEIMGLTPVSYDRIDQPGTGVNLGFIAQAVQQIFPNLVSTTSPTTLTPDGTLTLNYTGLIAPMVGAIQELSNEIASIESTVAGFASTFSTHVLNAGTGNFQKICVQKSDGTSVCVTGDQLASAIQGATQQTPIPQTSATTSTAPIIQIQGANPAIIQVGTAYSDLGAKITGPQADLNLGIATWLNGTLVNPLVIDTSAAATDTIDYVVTDQNGLTSTSTRTLIIEAAEQSNTSSSTNATTTSS